MTEADLQNYMLPAPVLQATFDMINQKFEQLVAQTVVELKRTGMVNVNSTCAHCEARHKATEHAVIPA